MKKKIMLFFVLFFLPSLVSAKVAIKQYLYDATVEPNGDVSVQELFFLEGDFNGFERIINFKNSSAPVFDGSESSFAGSDIYNGTSIELKEVQAFNLDSISINDFGKAGIKFQPVTTANSGDYRVYTKTLTSTGIIVKMFNPSHFGTRVFSLSYRIKNMAIRHKDIAELGYNIFSNELNNDIEKFEFYLHLPNNQKELRAWGHGPLNGYTKNINQETVYLRIDGLTAKTAIDVRAVFDLGVISQSVKESNVNGLESILKIEKKKAEDANKIRERDRIIANTVMVFRRIWIVGVFLLFGYCYRKYDKEYKSVFQGEYYRDFPAEYGPEVVGYLFHRYITDADFSASILSLIQRKKLKLEEPSKKEYELTLLNVDGLTKPEEELLELLFDQKEVGQKMTLAELKKKAKKHPETYSKSYETWKTKAKREAQKEDFFERNDTSKAFFFLYCVVGFLLAFYSITLEAYIAESFVTIFLAVVFCGYFLSFSRRTKHGNEDYHKWKALKKFMVDFGTMNEKELPEIHLWEKYLVYAVTLGCAKKLANAMAVKVQNYSATSYYFDPLDYLMFSNFSRQVNQTIQTSISTANTQNSSSGGFGGGFSSGGGSFGGGGGGGSF